MEISIKNAEILTECNVYLINQKSVPADLPFSQQEYDYIGKMLARDLNYVVISNGKSNSIIFNYESCELDYKCKNSSRKSGGKLKSILSELKIESCSLYSYIDEGLMLAFIEGAVLANYKFSKYLTDKSKLHQIKHINIQTGISDESAIKELLNVLTGVIHARDLVNEPVLTLNAYNFTLKLDEYAKSAGFELEIFDKQAIENMKMGGLLAVNKGSVDPPYFAVLRYKHENAKNEKPINFIGKGVVFDTGGLSLKATADSMDKMKSDMGGAATVAGLFYSAAINKLPVNIMGFIPLTDNRPGGNAITPGDVITMHDGTTVEVLNTDAEGRLILADAISYANSFEPELMITVATLTGAAHSAIGKQGISTMSNANQNYNKLIELSGFNTYERLVFFPLWDEYKEMIKSDIADLKNIGGPTAGMITAGKFLEHFAKHPLIHLDIAGIAFFDKADDYIPKGASGVGVRLLYDFLKKL